MDFEKNLSRLEEIVGEMEKGEISLDNSLKLFEEGVKISRSCHKSLEKAEMRVQKLMGFDKEGQPELEELDENE